MLHDIITLESNNKIHATLKTHFPLQDQEPCSYFGAEVKDDGHML